MGARGLFGLGALAFWLPEIALYAWHRQELNAKLVTFLLPSALLFVYLLVSALRTKRIAKPSAAIFMVLGVVSSGRWLSQLARPFEVLDSEVTQVPHY
jgi:hypothetical protein